MLLHEESPTVVFVRISRPTIVVNLNNNISAHVSFVPQPILVSYNPGSDLMAQQNYFSPGAA